MGRNNLWLRCPFSVRCLLALALLVSCSCASRYHPQGLLGDGFAEEKLDGDRWLVRFAASAFTPDARIETFLLFRCAEIARANDSRYFVVSPTGGRRAGPSRPDLIDHPAWGEPSPVTARREAAHREETVLLQLFRTRKPEGYTPIYETNDVMSRLESQIKKH